MSRVLSNKADCAPSHRVSVHCDNSECKFELGVIAIIDAVFKISMDGGYVKYDCEGGIISECPECHCDTIVFES